MRDLALPRLAAELALSQAIPLDDALAEAGSVLPVVPPELRRARNAAQRGDLAAALEGLGYGHELRTLMIHAPAQARALSLRGSAIPELNLLLMPLLGLVPLLLASAWAPLLAALLLGRAMKELPLPDSMASGALRATFEVSGRLWGWLLPLDGMVVIAGGLCFLVALGSPRLRATLFPGIARALEDARRLSWSAAFMAAGLDPTPALSLLSASARAAVARARASEPGDLERLAADAVLEARRRTARVMTGLRLGLGLLAVFAAATVALHVSSWMTLLLLQEAR